jgi:hypothetical protein
MPKRKERVAPPPRADGWDFRFATNEAVKGWEQLCSAATALTVIGSASSGVVRLAFTPAS